MAVEILSINIQHNKKIKGIQIYKKKLKISQLADDTTLFLRDILSLRTALNVLYLFSQISGLKLNLQKTELLPIGRQPDNLKCCKIKIVKRALSLGIWYYTTVKETIFENHKKRLEQFKNVLKQWQRHH